MDIIYFDAERKMGFMRENSFPCLGLFRSCAVSSLSAEGNFPRPLRKGREKRSIQTRVN